MKQIYQQLCSDISNICTKITWGGQKDQCLTCSSYEVMNIAPLQKVCTDFIVRHFVHSQGISPKLTEQIKHCEVVYSTGLLKELVARYPTVLTDELLEILCHRNISTLNLQKCSQLTQRGLKSTLERCVPTLFLSFSRLFRPVIRSLIDSL